MIDDLRLAIRTLARNSGFALATILTLAIGIGANTSIFTIVNAVLLRPISLPDSGRIIFIQEGTRQAPWQATSLADLADYRKQNTAFEQIEASTSADLNLTSTGRPERLLAAVVTPGYFRMMGAAPLLGRTFTSDEDQPGKNHVIVLSEKLWRTAFGADARIAGRSVAINGDRYTVAGVMPVNFRFPFTMAEAWVPLAPDRAALERGHRFLEITGRLKAGVTIERAQAQMNGILNRLGSEYPETNAGRRVVLRTLHDQRTRNLKTELSILLGAVTFVFLMGCANVANLLLARCASRAREFAIRRALGAGRWRLLRQFLVEAFVLAFAGALLGCVFASWGADLLMSLPGMPVVDDLALDATVLAFAVGLSIVATIVMALAGALQSWRVRVSALKQGARTASAGSAPARARRILVTGEIALAVVLLVAAGLLIESFWKLYRTNPGFDPGHVVAMRVSLPASEYAAVLEKISSLPRVTAAAAATELPLEQYSGTGGFEIEGRPPAGKDDTTVAKVRAVSPDYFKTLGVPFLAGRTFETRDDAAHPGTAIVNQRLATLYFPGANPIGRRVRIAERGWMTIVGIAGDVKDEGVGRAVQPEITMPYMQLPGSRKPLTMSLAVRANGDTKTLIAAIRTHIATVDPEQPVYLVRTIDQAVWDSIGGDRSGAEVMGSFGALAALLAAVGIYGVVSYLVRQRRQEIGVRIALGARTGEILRMVILQALRLAFTGIALGLVGAFALTRVMAGHIYVDVTDPVAFTAVPLFLAAVAIVATIVPAVSATRVDPIEALRYE